MCSRWKFTSVQIITYRPHCCKYHQGIRTVFPVNCLLGLYRYIIIYIGNSQWYLAMKIVSGIRFIHILLSMKGTYMKGTYIYMTEKKFFFMKITELYHNVSYIMRMGTIRHTYICTSCLPMLNRRVIFIFFSQTINWSIWKSSWQTTD